MGIFSKARDMYTLQKEAKTVKKELKNTRIEAEVDGVTVLINGEQEILSLAVSDALLDEVKAAEFGRKKLEGAILKSINKAMKKAQEIAGAKMKGLWGQMGMPQ